MSDEQNIESEEGWLESLPGDLPDDVERNDFEVKADQVGEKKKAADYKSLQDILDDKQNIRLNRPPTQWVAEILTRDLYKTATFDKKRELADLLEPYTFGVVSRRPLYFLFEKEGLLKPEFVSYHDQIRFDGNYFSRSGAFQKHFTECFDSFRAAEGVLQECLSDRVIDQDKVNEKVASEEYAKLSLVAKCAIAKVTMNEQAATAAVSAMLQANDYSDLDVVAEACPTAPAVKFVQQENFRKAIGDATNGDESAIFQVLREARTVGIFEPLRATIAESGATGKRLGAGSPSLVTSAILQQDKVKLIDLVSAKKRWFIWSFGDDSYEIKGAQFFEALQVAVKSVATDPNDAIKNQRLIAGLLTDSRVQKLDLPSLIDLFRVAEKSPMVMARLNEITAWSADPGQDAERRVALIKEFRNNAAIVNQLLSTPPAWFWGRNPAAVLLTRPDLLVELYQSNIPPVSRFFIENSAYSKVVYAELTREPQAPEGASSIDVAFKRNAKQLTQFLANDDAFRIFPEAEEFFHSRLDGMLVRADTKSKMPATADQRQAFFHDLSLPLMMIFRDTRLIAKLDEYKQDKEFLRTWALTIPLLVGNLSQQAQAAKNDPVQLLPVVVSAMEIFSREVFVKWTDKNLPPTEKEFFVTKFSELLTQLQDINLDLVKNRGLSLNIVRLISRMPADLIKNPEIAEKVRHILSQHIALMANFSHQIQGVQDNPARLLEMMKLVKTTCTEEGIFANWEKLAEEQKRTVSTELTGLLTQLRNVIPSIDLVQNQELWRSTVELIIRIPVELVNSDPAFKQQYQKSLREMLNKLEHGQSQSGVLSFLSMLDTGNLQSLRPVALDNIGTRIYDYLELKVRHQTLESGKELQSGIDPHEMAAMIRGQFVALNSKQKEDFFRWVLPLMKIENPIGPLAKLADFGVQAYVAICQSWLHFFDEPYQADSILGEKAQEWHERVEAFSKAAADPKQKNIDQLVGQFNQLCQERETIHQHCLTHQAAEAAKSRLTPGLEEKVPLDEQRRVVEPRRDGLEPIELSLPSKDGDVKQRATTGPGWVSEAAQPKGDEARETKGLTR